MINISNLKSEVKHITGNILFTRFSGDKHTPLTGEEGENKVGMIDYLNDEAINEVAQLLHEFANIQLTPSSTVMVEDIFAEGVLIRYLTDTRACLQLDKY